MAVDLVISEGLGAADRHPFKGNIDTGRLAALLGSIALGRNHAVDLGDYRTVEEA